MGDFSFTTESDIEGPQPGDSDFVGPVQATDTAFGGTFVTSGNLATQSSSPVPNIVTRGNLDAQPSSSVPGIVTRKDGTDAGIGFASLVGSISGLTKQGLDIAKQVAPKETQKVLQRVPGQSGLAGGTPVKSNSMLTPLFLAGGALLSGLLVYKLVKG